MRWHGDVVRGVADAPVGHEADAGDGLGGVADVARLLAEAAARVRAVGAQVELEGQQGRRVDLPAAVDLEGGRVQDVGGVVPEEEDGSAAAAGLSRCGAAAAARNAHEDGQVQYRKV